MKEDTPNKEITTEPAVEPTANTVDSAEKTEKIAEKPANPESEEPQDAPKEEGQDEAPSLRTIIRQQAIEDELPLSKNITLKKILGGDILNTQFLRRQLWVIVLVALFIIVYISNRYKCQQNLIKIDKLTKELRDAKYRALSSSSDLTQQTRESMVLERLRTDKDSTLHIATQPPYIIIVPNQEVK